MLTQLATAVHPQVMETVNDIQTWFAHPLVQESQKTLSGHASRKSTHESATYRRDTTTSDEAQAATPDYETNYAECWFSSTSDLPYNTYW